MATQILVVEDSRTQAEALRALLTDAGYSVVLATNGEAGLAQTDAHQFAVVISDIVMPGAVDGYELCRRIKGQIDQATRRDLIKPREGVRLVEFYESQMLAKTYLNIEQNGKKKR